MTYIAISPLAAVLIVGGMMVLTVVLILSVLRYRDESLKRAEANRAKIEQLTTDMALMQKQFSPFWTMVQDNIAEHLTHPSQQFREMDGLLKKLQTLDISDDERKRLIVLLRQRAVTSDLEVTEIEKESASIMLGVMRQVVTEATAQAATDGRP